jgi:hypothetical protein
MLIGSMFTDENGPENLSVFGIFPVFFPVRARERFARDWILRHVVLRIVSLDFVSVS